MTAGAQAGNYYASQLSDKIPELQQLAYSMYLGDIDRQVQNLGLLNQMDTTQYGRYRDTVADELAEYNSRYNAYRDSVSDNQWQSEYDYTASRDDRDYMYQLERDAIKSTQGEKDEAYDRAMAFIKLGVMPEADMLAAAGIFDYEVQALLGSINGAGGGGYGGGSGGAAAASGNYASAASLVPPGGTPDTVAVKMLELIKQQLMLGIITEEEAERRIEEYGLY